MSDAVIFGWAILVLLVLVVIGVPLDRPAVTACISAIAFLVFMMS